MLYNLLYNYNNSNQSSAVLDLISGVNCWRQTLQYEKIKGWRVMDSFDIARVHRPHVASVIDTGFKEKSFSFGVRLIYWCNCDCVMLL